MGDRTNRQTHVDDSLVMGIEDARKAVLASGNTTLDAKIVDVLRRHQQADCVEPSGADLVDRLTGYTWTG